MRAFTIILLSLFTCSAYSQDAGSYLPEIVPLLPGDTPEIIAEKAASVKPSPRQATWQELEVTCFLHFGINTFTNREWGRKEEDPALFNPVLLDARQWAKAAKLAGAKLMIIVARHHDGFCLWPSAFTDYSVKASPWRKGKGDVVAEVAAACREEGLKMGIYLSPWDMHSSLYGTDDYNTYYKNQLRELLSNYGEISEVWFDGACGEGPNGKRQVYDWPGFYSLVRELQPGAVIAITGPDVRWVGNESGDGNETEWSVVQDSTSLRWYPSEVDVSIRPGWFYHPAEDSLVKTPEQLTDIYYQSVGRNSVLLLNIPPDTRGLIPDHDIRSLRGMRAILDSTFAVNLAEKAIKKPLKGLPEGSAAYDLLKKRTFDRLMLKENFRKGQKVSAFSLEAFVDGQWKEVCRGTTIGYKRLLRFDPVTARYVRLKILHSLGKTEISGFGLYLSPVGH